MILVPVHLYSLFDIPEDLSYYKGKTFFTVKPEIIEWINDHGIEPMVAALSINEKGEYYHVPVGELSTIRSNNVIGLIDVRLCFDGEEEAILFKMTWL